MARSRRSDRLRTEYEQAYSGQWFDVEPPLFISCCHCGLVHRVEHRIGPKGKFQIRLFEELRMTGQLRRHNKYRCVGTKERGGKYHAEVRKRR